MKENNSSTIVAINTDIAVHKAHSAEWAKCGIRALCIETMNEAISLLVHSDGYLFVVINEDSVPGYVLQLRIMRDVTDKPIIIMTTGYTVEKKITAFNYGADMYEPFYPRAKDNVLSVLEMLKAQDRWAKREHIPMPVLTGGGIILSKTRRKVFVNDTEISLTRKEFDVLQYLMANNGHVVPHIRLLKHVWGDEYSGTDAEVLWRTINRLRGKLSKASANNNYIKVERGIGYQFLP